MLVGVGREGVGEGRDGVAVGISVEVKVGLAVGVDICTSTTVFGSFVFGQRAASKIRQTMAIPSQGQMSDGCFRLEGLLDGDVLENMMALLLPWSFNCIILRGEITTTSPTYQSPLWSTGSSSLFPQK